MNLITVTSPLDPRDLHALYEAAAADTQEEVCLQIPADMTLVAPLDYGVLTQALISWGLRCEKSVLYVHMDDVSRAANDPPDHLLVACLVARRIVRSDGLDITSELRDATLRSASERNYFAPDSRALPRVSRKSVFLPSFLPLYSHSPDLHAVDKDGWAIEESARTLYHDVWRESESSLLTREPVFKLGEDFVGKGRYQHVARVHWPRGHPLASLDQPFRALAARMLPLSPLAAEIANPRTRAKPAIDELGEALFELVQNTEWHTAQRPGGTTGRNIRVVSFAKYRYALADLVQLRDADPGLATYLEAAMRMSNESVAITVGVASIIDSGVGLARSAAENNGISNALDPSTEIRYLIAALSKTLRVSRSDMGNIGLPRVQQILTNLRGYMLIRTGRTELRRDFVSNAWEPIDRGRVYSSSQRSLFVDWIPMYGPMAVDDRVGTDVTMVVPLDYEFEEFER